MIAKRRDHQASLIGHPIETPAETEVMLFLIWLKHYPYDILLAIMFQVHKKTAKKIHNRMMEWYYNLKKHKISFKTKAYRDEFKVNLLYEDFTVILDGSEQEVERSSNPLIDTLFFSGKSFTHCINILIFVALNKDILYLSPSVPGSVGDLVLARQTESEWGPHLIRDGIMGDEGFNGLEKTGHRVLTSEKFSDFGHIFSSFRIRVENVLACIKNWRICKDKLRFKINEKDEILEKHHKIWTIVSIFVNKFYR